MFSAADPSPAKPGSKNTLLIISFAHKKLFLELLDLSNPLLPATNT